MDRAAGRLLERLEAMGEADNTLVIFTSDNGSYNGPSCEPWRGRKGGLWQGGIRVPGIVRFPGRIEAGSSVNEPAGIVDLLPTVCDAVGIAGPDVILDGASLWPGLTQGRSIERSKPLYWFFSPSRPVCTTRDGDWCLVADPTIDINRNNFFREEWIGEVKATKLKNFRLYNLREDPHQDTDVSAEHAERFERMKREMNSLHQEVVADGPDWRKRGAKENELD
jgi:arylsulfatase A